MTNVSRRKGDLLYRTTKMKAMNLHVERLEEKGRNLAVENERLRVTKRQVIGLPMYCSRPKHSERATKRIVEILDEQYVGVGLHRESIFNAWCVKEVAELQHFNNQPRPNYRRGEVTECDVWWLLRRKSQYKMEKFVK